MKAFTIIEVMISVAIFSVVMTMALGALLSVSQSDSRAEALKSVVNGLNFALDEVSRIARTGTQYDCGAILPLAGSPTQTDCASSPSSELAFLASDGVTTYGYCLGSGGSCTGTVQCPAGSSCDILRSVDGGTLLPITAPAVQISTLAFYVLGTEGSVQPKITMLLSGTAASAGDNSNFNIQTSVTQRIYDQ
jgi:prepilin-type N-terminal cleavage/methylation domain-containing protein